MAPLGESQGMGVYMLGIPVDQTFKEITFHKHLPYYYFFYQPILVVGYLLLLSS